jgi:hypothetical protein
MLIPGHDLVAEVRGLFAPQFDGGQSFGVAGLPRDLDGVPQNVPLGRSREPFALDAEARVGSRRG